MMYDYDLETLKMVAKECGPGMDPHFLSILYDAFPDLVKKLEAARKAKDDERYILERDQARAEVAALKIRLFDEENVSVSETNRLLQACKERDAALIEVKCLKAEIRQLHEDIKVYLEKRRPDSFWERAASEHRQDHEAATANVAVLRAAGDDLLKFVDHDNCKFYSSDGKRCTCGLSATIRRWHELLGKDLSR